MQANKLKRILIILSISGFCSSGFHPHSFGQSFNITAANIDLEIKGVIKPADNVLLTHAVKYKDKFYCFFREFREDNANRNQKFCFVFSKTGNNLKRIEVPDEIQNTAYYDLFVKNEKLFVKTYLNEKTFYYNSKRLKWIRTKNSDDLIFEDENFFVYSLDFGEWGGKTWFRDKKTKAEYLIESTTPLVNKIGSIYYLTKSFEVLKIENPFDLNKCDDDVTYKNIKKDAKFAYWYGKPIGFEVVYRDTTTNYSYLFDHSYEPYIVSSFAWKNDLFHIYETDTATYIAKTVDNLIKPIQKIGEKMSFYNWYNSYRSKIQEDGKQVLKFRVDNDFGLMEINGQEIKIYYLLLK